MKRPIFILMTIAFASLLGVGFVQAYVSYSPSYDYSSYSSTCDECEQGSSAQHYRYYIANVECPDCGHKSEEGYSTERSDSSSCEYIFDYVNITRRCSSCEMINDILDDTIRSCPHCWGLGCSSCGSPSSPSSPLREPYNPPPPPPDTPRREEAYYV